MEPPHGRQRYSGTGVTTAQDHGIAIKMTRYLSISPEARPLIPRTSQREQAYYRALKRGFSWKSSWSDGCGRPFCRRRL